MPISEDDKIPLPLNLNNIDRISRGIIGHGINSGHNIVVNSAELLNQNATGKEDENQYAISAAQRFASGGTLTASEMQHIVTNGNHQMVKSADQLDMSMAMGEGGNQL